MSFPSRTCIAVTSIKKKLYKTTLFDAAHDKSNKIIISDDDCALNYTGSIKIFALISGVVRIAFYVR